MIFDESGEIVWKMAVANPVQGRARPVIRPEEVKLQFSLGDRVFDWMRWVYIPYIYSTFWCIIPPLDPPLVIHSVDI